MEEYLLVKGIAGLGNRILALGTAIVYARLTHRTLAIDWRDGFYSVPGQNAFPALFELVDLPHISPEEIADQEVYPALWQHRLQESLESVIEEDSSVRLRMGQSFLKKYSYSVRQLSYLQPVVIAAGYTEELEPLRPLLKRSRHPWGQLSKRQLFHEVFHRHLRPTQAIERRLRQFRQAHFGQGPVIGIHIRQSDKSIGLGWYRKALAEHVGRQPQATIFLATDNRAVEAEIKALYPQVITQDKWLPTPGSRAHGSEECPDRLAHAAEALVDILLLASCDWLIYSRTTSFGLLASYISQQPLSQHFDIQTYYDRQQRTLKGRIARLWRKIDHRVRYFFSFLKWKGLRP